VLYRDPTVIFLPCHCSSIIVHVLTLIWCSRSVSQPLYQDTLRHCATSRKVAVSIPDGGIVVFHSPNPSVHTMALSSSQLLTEMSTRNISGGGGGRRPVRRADNLITFKCA
jgi:hypothetical protein